VSRESGGIWLYLLEPLRLPKFHIAFWQQLQTYGHLKVSGGFDNIWLYPLDTFKVSKISYNVVQVLSYCSWTLQEVRFSLSLRRCDDGENPASPMRVSPGLLLTTWDCYGSWRQKKNQ
jgi:hypothetical protein